MSLHFSARPIVLSSFVVLLLFSLGICIANADSDTAQMTRLTNELLGKATPDACFFGIGDPANEYDPGLVLPCPGTGEAKVNQAYVWGLTKAGDDLWFGTAANVLCFVEGSYLQYTNPQINDCWVCEFEESQFFSPDPPPDPRIGDWRPPRIFVYETQTNSLIEKTNDIPYPHNLRLKTTLGIRSAGSSGDMVFLGGPGLSGGINIFAFDVVSGSFLNSTNLPEYSNIRKWLEVDGSLYTAVGKTAGGGAVLRWTGNELDIFKFDVVGELDGQGAELAYHEGRLFASTWPGIGRRTRGTPPAAGIWMSPELTSQGLSTENKHDWAKIWSASDYDPDLVTAATYGGGSLSSFDGYLYWGTMHVPLVAYLAHNYVYGEPPDIQTALMTFLGTHRAISIFRGKNLATSPIVELVYGDPFLPKYSQPRGSTETESGYWEMVPNKMGAYPLHGPSGFGNFFNNYTWTMGVYKDQLYVGTMDWSYILSTMLNPLLEPYLSVIPKNLLQIANHFYGADLFRFANADSRAVPESQSGVGNYTNYGIRTMVADEDAIYLGTANPMNLLTNTGDDKPEGGWELRSLTGLPGPVPSPAASESHPAMVYNPERNQYFVVYTKLDKTGKKLYGRFVDPDGTPAGNEFPIDDNGAYDAFPSVAFDSDRHRYLVIWTRIGQTGESLGASIFGRLFKADGQPYAAAFQLSTESAPGSMAARFLPTTAYGKVNGGRSDANGFMVVWTDFQILAQGELAPNISLVGQNVLWNGSLAGENFPITNLDGDVPAATLFPSIAYDNSQNRYFVAWANMGSDVSGSSAQIMDQLLNDRAVLSLFASANGDAGSRILGRFVDPNGECSASISISSHDSAYVASYDSFPSVAFGKVKAGAAETEGFLTAWSSIRAKDETTPLDIDIFGQILKNDGALIGGNFSISREGHATPVAPLFPKLAAGWTPATGETFLAVWPDTSDALSRESEDMDLVNIFGQYLQPDGSYSGENFIISSAALLQSKPALAYNGADNNFLAGYTKNNPETFTIDVTFSPVKSQKAFYVDIRNGNDANDGSIERPWKTLHHAISRINAGPPCAYTLYVAGGSYSVNNGEADSELILLKDHVTIVGEADSRSVIEGKGALNWPVGIKVSASHTCLINLHITGFAHGDGIGVDLIAGTNNTVQNCRVSDNDNGISVWQSKNCTVKECKIDNNNLDGISFTQSTGGLITQNTVHGHYDIKNSDGIIVQACNPEISRNTLYGNRFNISLQADKGETTSPTIKNNLVYMATRSSGKVEYGILMGGKGTTGPIIYHNTIDGGLYDGIYMDGTGSTPHIKYNIITNFGQVGIRNLKGLGSPTIDYNDIWGNASGPYDGCGPGDNDIYKDPQYGSHTLLDSSPCINAISLASGDPITIDKNGDPRPYGAGYDMGCYEKTNLPLVSTDDVSSISATSATSGGNVTSAGGETSIKIKARGVCWSTGPDPTINDSHTSDGTGLGSFISNITGLSPDTTYHVRAYATNSNNLTGYGSDLTFTTTVAPPTVTSFNPTSGVPDTSVTIKGTGFINTSKVKFGGTPAKSFLVDSATQITAVVGDGATGKVSVTTPGGTAESHQKFTFHTVTAGAYHVNVSTGDDLNDGSAARPWKTLHHAISQINGGETGNYALIVGPGTYGVSSKGNRAKGEADDQLILSQSNVTIIGDSDNPPLVDGNNATNWPKGVEVTGSNDVIENLWFTGFSDTKEEGVRITMGNGNQILQCRVYGNNSGIRVMEATETTIRNCEVFVNTTNGIDLIKSPETDVVDNKIYDNTESGIRAEGSTEISRNSIFDNDFGILVEALTGNSASPVIMNNVIYRTETGTMRYGIYTRAENGSQSNAEIYHNTVDGGTKDGITTEKDGSSSSKPLVKYNIITNFGQYGIQNVGANPAIDYNDVWNNSAGNYRGCQKGTHDINKDPKFASYSLWKYSPCINIIPTTSGDPVTVDYLGFARPRPDQAPKDMGAYEYVGSVKDPYDMPGGTGQVTDYRIFTVPFYMTGAEMLSAMEKVLGTYNNTTWRGFTTVDGGYVEFSDKAFQTLSIIPGMGFWIVTLLTDTIPFKGGIAPDGVNYELTLRRGWHLVGLPWVSQDIDLGNILVTDGLNTHTITSAQNNLTQRVFWDFTGNGPYKGYEKRDVSSYLLKCGTGYFLEVLSNQGVTLIIPWKNDRSRSVERGSTGDEDEPPPPPGVVDQGFQCPKIHDGRLEDVNFPSTADCDYTYQERLTIGSGVTVQEGAVLRIKPVP